jgi:hypothetical protein
MSVQRRFNPAEMASNRGFRREAVLQGATRPFQALCHVLRGLLICDWYGSWRGHQAGYPQSAALVAAPLPLYIERL